MLVFFITAFKSITKYIEYSIWKQVASNLFPNLFHEINHDHGRPQTFFQGGQNFPGGAKTYYSRAPLTAQDGYRVTHDTIR